MGQDKVRMTHRVELGEAHWECAIVDGVFYSTNYVDSFGHRHRDMQDSTRKQSVEEVYKGYEGYVVKKINSFKGNV